VIGVNAQIESDSGDNAGIGFAIPSNTIKAIAAQLISSGNVQHAYLGVKVTPISESVAQQVGGTPGLGIDEVVSGEAADKAGLQAATGSANAEGQSYPTGGDVITAIDGQKVSGAAELQSAVDGHRPGDKVRVTVTRDGKSRTVTVTLGTRPAQAS
jgi:S1-C subfamily serine protease